MLRPSKQKETQLTIIFEETCSIGHNEIKKEYTENDFKKDNIELLKGFNKIY